MSIEELEAAALKLDMHERARLPETLLSSLEALSAAESERLWAEEVLCRLDELDQGRIASRPAEDVLRSGHVPGGRRRFLSKQPSKE